MVTSDAEGSINADLTLGADVVSVKPLKANEGLSSPGVKLHGSGFIVSPTEADHLGLGRREGLDAHIRPYLNGRDLVQKTRGAMVIDLLGVDEDFVMTHYPEVYQHLRTEVYAKKWNPKAVKGKGAWEGREVNRRESYKNFWWLHGEPRKDMRPAMVGLKRFIATVETTKHRLFQMVDAQYLPDNMVIAISTDDAFHLGVLSSEVHLQWIYSKCSLMGVATFEQGHRYNKSQIFDPFPFPDATPDQSATIAELAEKLDATRKAALAEVPGLTMTEIYNLRARLQSGEKLSPTDEDRARAARAGIVHRLHEQIDAVVAEAYGWPADLTPSEIVTRLVALNAERAKEEAEGNIRWLRPEYQIPRFALGTKSSVRKSKGK